MKQDYDIEQLDAFLDGQLNEVESAKIQGELQSDTALRENLTLLKLSREAIKRAGVEKEIKKAHHNFLANRNSSKVLEFNPWRWTKAIAASLLIFLSAFAAISYFSVSPSSFDSKFPNYELPILRAEVEEESLIENSYASQDFQKAIDLATSMKTKSNMDQFLIGLSYLEIGDFKNAENIFLEMEAAIESSGQSSYSDELDFYLTETWIKTENFDKALQRIGKIKQDPKHPYFHNFTRWDKFKIQLLEWKK